MAKANNAPAGKPPPGMLDKQGDVVESEFPTMPQRGRGFVTPERDKIAGNRRIVELPRPDGLGERAPWKGK